MASMWFRCPVCGTLVPGDPRYPPMCPNIANHPRVPLGQPRYQQVLLPARPPTWRERYRAYQARRRRQAWKLLGIFFGCMLIFLCVGIALRTILSVIDPGPPTQPHVITDATLGGTIAAFQAKYGTPQADGSGSTRAWKITIQGIPALISVTPANDAASDGQDHIIAIHIGPDGSTWNQSTADEVIQTFLPADATYQKDQEVPGVGTAQVYLSPDLGATFPASDFVDPQGHPVTPGTCWTAFNASQQGASVLMLGT
jgi:hypothetical protein